MLIDRFHYDKLSEEMKALSDKVKEVGIKQEEDEDLAASAPEEFLDPIMSHLMTDPVLLPTSHVSYVV